MHTQIPPSHCSSFPTHKKKKFANLKSKMSKNLIVAWFFYLSSISEIATAKAKEILTRVGFEPTPFRTSVLEEP